MHFDWLAYKVLLVRYLNEARPSSKSAADHCILMTLTTVQVQVRTIWSMAICIVAKALPSIQNEAFIKKSSQFKHWRVPSRHR